MKGPAVGSATAEAVHKGVFLIMLATLCIVLMKHVRQGQQRGPRPGGDGVLPGW